MDRQRAHPFQCSKVTHNDCKAPNIITVRKKKGEEGILTMGKNKR